MYTKHTSSFQRNEVLRKKSMVSELQLLEEFINDFTVFTEAAKDALTNALVTKAHETEKVLQKINSRRNEVTRC